MASKNIRTTGNTDHAGSLILAPWNVLRISNWEFAKFLMVFMVFLGVPAAAMLGLLLGAIELIRYVAR